MKYKTFIEPVTTCILSPIQYFPHFPAGTQFPASYLKWMASANKFSRFPPKFPPLKNSPSHSKQKTPHFSFFHGSNLDNFHQIIGSFHFICNVSSSKESANITIFIFSKGSDCFLSEIFLWDIFASNPIFNPSSFSDAGKALEGGTTPDICKKIFFFSQFSMVLTLCYLKWRHMCILAPQDVQKGMMVTHSLSPS